MRPRAVRLFTRPSHRFTSGTVRLARPSWNPPVFGESGGRLGHPGGQRGFSSAPTAGRRQVCTCGNLEGSDRTLRMALLGFVGAGALHAAPAQRQPQRTDRFRQNRGAAPVHCARLRLVTYAERPEVGASRDSESVVGADGADIARHAAAEDRRPGQRRSMSWARDLRVQIFSMLVAVGTVLLPGSVMLPARRVSAASAASQIFVVAKKDKGSSKKSTPSSPAAASEKDGKRTLDPKTENMLGYGAAGIAFSAFALRMFQVNQNEKRLENERIEAEIERLEKLKQEFLDVDEESDEEETANEMMESLRKRLGQVGGSEGHSGAGGSEESESESEAEKDERDMLKRMWDASGADSGGASDDKKKPKNPK
ncbi:hypothetical protein FVE85_8354 [Porphyridium purpureum]|uniref:Uncharacterized protein n=1 Tax=Porphyridium purpureum TaxID=35688 RepID=A0A5J4YLK6_PORPP|nr:hypothetical protein FVE85_8354 [Porphyridium purpureum]|eukprot:POR6743..scf244_11